MNSSYISGVVDLGIFYMVVTPCNTIAPFPHYKCLLVMHILIPS
jgi:hypothetical protein